MGKRWLKFFDQNQFSSQSFQGWRLALIEGKGLNVYNKTTTGNELCWTVALTTDGNLDQKNFAPVSSPLVGSAVMPLYDAQGQERAVIIGLTDKEYLLVSDPADDLGLEPSEPHLYDATGKKELALIVPTHVPGRLGCWTLIVAYLDTPKNESALKAVGGCRGAFVLRLHQIT